MHGVLEKYLERGHRKRWTNLLIVNLRILIGFAFVPAGLKKILYQPFTDPDKTGLFHDFLHAFYDTGFFYSFVGIVQLSAAILLCTQRFAIVGALLILPVIVSITVFCWSTSVIPTAIVATLILCGVLLIGLWDYEKWKPLFGGNHRAATSRPESDLLPPITMKIWERCGAGILLFYLSVCALTGEVYRPRGVEPDDIRFYIFPVIITFPIIAYYLDRQKLQKSYTSSH